MQNARGVLEHAWQTEVFTATDAMASVGLTRATIIGICDDLVAGGWLEERELDETARKGRPARRYALRERAGFVAGIDAGTDHIGARVADLRGRVIGSADVRTPARSTLGSWNAADGGERRRLTHEVVERALSAAGVNRSMLLAVTLGVPAPVDAAGLSPEGKNGFWAAMNPNFGAAFADAAPIVTVENDANLVAIAERASVHGQGRDVSSYIAMLVGEGIGSGLMIDGHLVRGRRGGAGEMRFLDYVDGVGTANGLALQARRWAEDAIRSGEAGIESPLGRLDLATLTEHDVARAAESGDTVAQRILDRLAERLARICIVLGDVLDVDRVVVGGAMVDSLPMVIGDAARLVAESGDPTAPDLRASALGAEAVATGAIEHALSLVRERALELRPAARPLANPVL
ncbi:putative NBD/HSP70 family sugar kinase [Okibacterium sp. HSC-33S16]|uniref:ROK family protein n=1 Tax=Okibacterium sp. HSC-33S16 TaxID=2910965 RepID=UPI0020A0D19D|nr:ROK family protein [Okibacterium sp. HSC-33S16]MCP2032589.1 putative NBD/HSP70 family sugar kinase [Okibacterium sp. HSC-33S16]